MQVELAGSIVYPQAPQRVNQRPYTSIVLETDITLAPSAEILLYDAVANRKICDLAVKVPDVVGYQMKIYFRQPSLGAGVEGFPLYWASAGLINPQSRLHIGNLTFPIWAKNGSAAVPMTFSVLIAARDI